MFDTAERQRNRERRALADAFTAGVDGSAMQLDQMPDDRQAKPQPAMLARGAGVGLPEALEKLRKMFRGNALPRVADGDLHGGRNALQQHLHASAFGREFDRVGEQVPDDLLK